MMPRRTTDRDDRSPRHLTPSPPRRFRLLALDVDGTLLDRDGRLRPATAEAVASAARAGLRPVLCTGRRYRRALPVARELGLDAPLVCNSGAIVKDPADHRTLWRADLEPGLFGALLELFRARDEPIVTFCDRGPSGLDFTIAACPTGRPGFDEYVALNREHAEIDPRWADRRSGHFHLCAVGERPAMLELEGAVLDAFPGLVRTFVQRSPRYTGWMCEVLDESASKWSAVLHLAALWGVDPSEICAVGDDMNDVPMLLGAGLGVAMAHAPAPVLEAADLVAGDHDADGLATVIRDVLLR
jgi:hydroxymethylpyrimidine pyrophosphatase-like HAD family hydrolase